MARVPLYPANPERICWGCDKFCPVDEMACGNEIVRAAHPIELFGRDWLEWTGGAAAPSEPVPQDATAPTVCQFQFKS